MTRATLHRKPSSFCYSRCPLNRHSRHLCAAASATWLAVHGAEYPDKVGCMPRPHFGGDAPEPLGVPSVDKAIRLTMFKHRQARPTCPRCSAVAEVAQQRHRSCGHGRQPHGAMTSSAGVALAADAVHGHGQRACARWKSSPATWRRWQKRLTISAAGPPRRRDGLGRVEFELETGRAASAGA